MAEIGADGINGDTQDGIPLSFFQAAEHDGHPLAFQPEHIPHDEAVAWNLMTWGQEDFHFVPEIYRDKWLEPRHMVNVSDRWSRDKTADLQFAFFNGVGWESWENVWGIWNGISPRDAEATRRMAMIDRAFSPFLVSAEWEPFYPVNPFGLFASRWPHGKATLWTIVNRNEYDIDAAHLRVPALDGARYFDVYHGVEIQPIIPSGENWVHLRFPIEAHGFGAVLQVVGNPDASVMDEMAKMKNMTTRPLSSYSPDRQILAQHIVETKPTPQSHAPNMIHIPGGDFLFDVMGVEIEGANDVTVDVQYPWENAARRYHQHSMRIHSFDMDKYPVTNKEFKAFLDVAHYYPKDDLNFLKDWKGGAYPPGWGDKPVTWVSIEDARAYAAWAGKRLPHEWEWQYAAQGVEMRKYPWGDTWRPDAVPIPDESRIMRGPDDVEAHPVGVSSYGVMDMVGNVWQWTDEYQDEHTRSAIVRGGSYYRPQGSKWYFPQTYQNDRHGKLLLMAPSKDRSGAIGFRCVADSDESHL
jgi:formylglycine-generating enzyme required for sulfatase activity